MTNSGRTIIIGLDGVPFEMIMHLSKCGVMPHTQELIDEGICRKMRSTIPEISSVAWSSMITGKNPGEHGIFGFMDVFEGSYRMRFPNFRDLQCEPFWDRWPGESVIINVPSTYPARQLDGIHISGFVSVDMARSVYPPELLDTLTAMDYRLDVDSQKAHVSTELFLSDLNKTLEARIRAGRHLWEAVDWQTFMLVFTGTDRLMHFLYDAYEDTDHKYHDCFLDHFHKIDTAIGELLSHITDNDLVLLHSDHGFERLDKDVNINYLLKEEGFLLFNGEGEATLKNISGTTRAFALDPSRIYINRAGKYPRGAVEEDAVEGVLSELEEMFHSLEVDGRKVLRGVYRKESIYSGPCTVNAPDLVLVAEEGFNLRANLKAQVLAEKGIFAGKHTQDNAFLLIRGAEDCGVVGDIPAIDEITKIIESANPALVAEVCN